MVSIELVEDKLRERFMLVLILSLLRTLENRMKKPELVLRSTKMYCCAVFAVATGKNPSINPRPSNAVKITIFRNAARILVP